MMITGPDRRAMCSAAAEGHCEYCTALGFGPAIVKGHQTVVIVTENYQKVPKTNPPFPFGRICFSWCWSCEVEERAVEVVPGI